MDRLPLYALALTAVLGVECPDNIQYECPTGFPDGSYLTVRRDPSHHCDLPEDCPCPYEVRTCGESSLSGEGRAAAVGRYRSPERECAFDPCPKDEDEKAVYCDVDVRPCMYASSGDVAGYVRRDPAEGCSFFPCEARHVIEVPSEACPRKWLCGSKGGEDDHVGYVVNGDPERGCAPPPECDYGLADAKEEEAMSMESAGEDGSYHNLRGHGRVKEDKDG